MSEQTKIKPTYYKIEGIPELWTIEERILGVCEIFRKNAMIFKLWCSALEYIFRCGMKGSFVEDIKKAITNLEKILEIVENQDQ